MIFCTHKRFRTTCLSRVSVALTLASAIGTVSVPISADDAKVDRSWRLSGGVSLLPGSDGDSRVGYGLTLSRALSRQTRVGAELTSSFATSSGDDDSTRIHTMIGGFVNHSLYAAQGISLSAGLSAGAAIARVRGQDGDSSSEDTEAFPYVEPRLSASFSVPGGNSRVSGSIGWVTLPGEDFSEPRFGVGFAF